MAFEISLATESALLFLLLPSLEGSGFTPPCLTVCSLRKPQGTENCHYHSSPPHFQNYSSQMQLGNRKWVLFYEVLVVSMWDGLQAHVFLLTRHVPLLHITPKERPEIENLRFSCLPQFLTREVPAGPLSPGWRIFPLPVLCRVSRRLSILGSYYPLVPTAPSLNSSGLELTESVFSTFFWVLFVNSYLRIFFH